MLQIRFVYNCSILLTEIKYTRRDVYTMYTVYTVYIFYTAYTAYTV